MAADFSASVGVSLVGVSEGCVSAVSEVEGFGVGAGVAPRARPLLREDLAPRRVVLERAAGVGVGAGSDALASSAGVGVGVGSSMRAPAEVTRRVFRSRGLSASVGVFGSCASARLAGAGANEPPKVSLYAPSVSPFARASTRRTSVSSLRT